MVTAFSQRELVARAVEAGVFGYLVKPFRETDLLPAIETARARHAELQAVRAESDSLRDALEARKLIERAKGLLMERDGLTEAEAFGRMRRAAQRPAARCATSPRRWWRRSPRTAGATELPATGI